jgi:hypothetical protein
MRLFCTNIIVITYPVQECGKQQPSRSKKKEKKRETTSLPTHWKLQGESNGLVNWRCQYSEVFFIFVGLPPNLETWVHNKL